MRPNFDKKHFTKPERIFGEILKRNHIVFQAKVKVQGKEIDFLIGMNAIEIGNHSQDTAKNSLLLEMGYNLLHLTNKEIYEDPLKVEQHLLNNWLN